MVEKRPEKEKTKKSGAIFVALGIFLSRIFGLIRERVFAHFFGNSDAGDAFKAALKIPNFLQNLFGEGALSASFIPVYAQLVEKDKEQADQLAKTIFVFLALAVSVLVLLGVLGTPSLISLIAPGFEGEKKQLTIDLVRIFFPGVGLLVLSAWCLGILNSHRKFFIPYVVPVVWNVAIIAALIYGRDQEQADLAITAGWGLVLGSLLQFILQIPVTLKFVSICHREVSAAGGHRGDLLQSNACVRWPRFARHDKLLEEGLSRSVFQSAPVLKVIKNFGPAVMSRGVVQISAYIDNVLASWLPTGAVSALAYAQTIYLLPISLFGMSISASELPELARTQTHADMSPEKREESYQLLKKRLVLGLEKVSFFIVPTVVAFFAFGDLIVKTLYKTGQFNDEDALLVWRVLMGSSIGLLSTTLGRLYSSSFYALHDTKTPLRFSLIRVFLTTTLGGLCAFVIPPMLHLQPLWGTAGLTASAGTAGWVEYLLLKRGLEKRIGRIDLLKASHTAKLWGMAMISGVLAYFLKFFVVSLPIPVLLASVATFYGVMYVFLGFYFQIPLAQQMVRKFKVFRNF